MKIPIRFSLTSSETRSKKSTIESLVNLYAEKSPEGALTDAAVYQCSGTTLFATISSEVVFGLHTMDNILYAFTRYKMYRINANGTADVLYTLIGDGLNGDRLSIADNGITLIVVDGVNSFKYDVVNGVVLLTYQVGMYPANTVTFQDGYFIFNRKDTGQFFISGIYDTTTDALDYATAESSPDDTLAGISFANQLFLFGIHTIEVWYNSGNALFPFQRVSGAVIPRGIHAPYSLAQGLFALIFIGDDRLVYSIHANSIIPQRISSYAVEKDIINEPLAYGFVFAEYGHEFYMLHLPNSAKTWCYDITTGAWHERKSPKLSAFDLVHDIERHLSNCYAEAYGKKFVGSRSADGKIFYLDNTTSLDDGIAVRREIISSPLYNNNQFVVCRSFELMADIKLRTNADPKAILQWTSDGVKWSDGVFLSLGKIGERSKRIIARRLGRFRQRTFKITITDDVDIIFLGAYVEVEQ